MDKAIFHNKFIENGFTEITDKIDLNDYYVKPIKCCICFKPLYLYTGSVTNMLKAHKELGDCKRYVLCNESICQPKNLINLIYDDLNNIVSLKTESINNIKTLYNL